MPNRTFRAAIFDFDETMINLEPQHDVADSSLCRAMGNDYLEMPESFRHASGQRVIDHIRGMKEHFGWETPMEELARVRQAKFDEACATSEIVLLPGVDGAVRALARRGLILAITSSAVGSSIEMILRRVGLRDFFALIVDGSSVTHPKPHPEPYLVTAAKLGIDPAACVVFEDSEIGVLSARAAGAHCVAVRNPVARMRQDLSAADMVIESFEDLDVEKLLNCETPKTPRTL
jgi:HAD superfamily hydrolase (TIGR01509 family)